MRVAVMRVMAIGVTGMAVIVMLVIVRLGFLAHRDSLMTLGFVGIGKKSMI